MSSEFIFAFYSNFKFKVLDGYFYQVSLANLKFTSQFRVSIPVKDIG